MTGTQGRDTSEAIWEIRDLLRLLAEPAIAARDSKRREELKKLVGSSIQKAKAVVLMDGTRTQTDIHNGSGCHRGNLSTLVKELSQASLLIGDPKQPQLAISIPNDFFEVAE